MRNPVRRIAYVGEPDRGVQAALRDYGIRVEALPGDSLVGLARALYRLRPAAVHARQGHLMAALVTKLLQIPLVVHAGREDVSALTARAARMASRTLCGGASVREALLALGAPASSTCVLRSLVDAAPAEPAVFPPLLDSATRWLVAASPCDGPDRGHQDLLLAFLGVARKRPNLKLLIAGDGSEARRLRTQAAEAGVLARVVVQPIPIAHLPSVFAHAAAVVAPSRSGSLPDPVPEALAAGAPVVATATGMNPTWIHEGNTGWLVPPRAPVALASRLAQVLDQAAHAKQVGANARAAALELATPRSIAQELARCYAAVGRGPSQPLGLYLPAPLQRA